MAIPTQTEGNKKGITPILASDTDDLVYNPLGDIRIYVGTTSPNGQVTAPKGSLFIELGTPKLYQNTDAVKTWEAVGGQT